MTKNVVILDSNLSDSKFGGKTIRLLNIFRRLKDRYNLFYFPLVNIEKVPDYLYDVFPYIFPIKLDIFPSRLQKLYCYLQFQPAYNYMLCGQSFLRSVWEKINACIPLIDIDVVHVFDFYIGSVGLYGKKLLRLDAKFVWDIGDSWWLMQKRKLANSFFLSFFLSFKELYFAYMFMHYETGLVRTYDSTILVGYKEFQEYSLSLRRKLMLIPNGVNESFLNYNYTISNVVPKSLIFTGNMDYPPNREAVSHFLSDIYPNILAKNDDVVLYLVGRNADKLKSLESERIRIVGEVEDIRPFIANSHIYIAPIRLGGGIKNKLLEAMALGKDIVCYPETVEGFGKPLPSNVHIVYDEYHFANKAIELLNKPVSIHRESIDFIRSNYTWDMAVKKYVELYDKRNNSGI